MYLHVMSRDNLSISLLEDSLVEAEGGATDDKLNGGLMPSRAGWANES